MIQVVNFIGRTLEGFLDKEVNKRKALITDDLVRGGMYLYKTGVTKNYYMGAGMVTNTGKSRGVTYQIIMFI